MGMNNAIAARSRIAPAGVHGNRPAAVASAMLLLTLLAVSLVEAGTDRARREQLVPILGVTLEQNPTGTVAYLVLSFEERTDRNGLVLSFKHVPGRFSKMAQTAVQQAIYRTARSLGLSPDSWTVMLSVPYPGVTIYGESLSAMIGLCVAALSQGKVIAQDLAMTGTVTPDGRIGPVGSVPLKVAAAGDAHLHRVLVPEEQDPADGDYPIPFLMQISPVRSVGQAYAALTASSDSP